MEESQETTLHILEHDKQYSVRFLFRSNQRIPDNIRGLYALSDLPQARTVPAESTVNK